VSRDTPVLCLTYWLWRFIAPRYCQLAGSAALVFNSDNNSTAAF